MGEANLRKEQRQKQQEIVQKAHANMKKALAETSKTKGGLMVLRYFLHESGFLAPLCKETAEGVNTDLLIANEAKRLMYLILRSHMDEDTVLRVEFDQKEKEGGEKNG
jgi:hypothetical protein